MQQIATEINGEVLVDGTHIHYKYGIDHKQLSVHEDRARKKDQMKATIDSFVQIVWNNSKLSIDTKMQGRPQSLNL